MSSPEVPMMHGATPASVSAASTSATSVPFATATANQVRSPPSSQISTFTGILEIPAWAPDERCISSWQYSSFDQIQHLTAADAVYSAREEKRIRDISRYDPIQLEKLFFWFFPSWPPHLILSDFSPTPNPPPHLHQIPIISADHLTSHKYVTQM